MDLRQLEYFVAVAEEANFTRAAERVHISQSGVSAQIRQLERELGASLFDRTTRSAALTDAGEAALGHARAALAAAEAVRRAVDDVNAVVRGRLTVGMVVGCTVTPLFDALATFCRAHPGVTITLVEDSSAQLVDRVRRGAVDLALVGTAGQPPAGVGSATIVSERLVAAVPPDHALATRTKVTVAEVARCPLVCLPVGTGIREAFDRACAAQDLAPDVLLQATAPDAVADLATRGVGVGVLSESTVTGRDDLAVRVIEDADVPALLALVWTPVVSPALGKLLDHARGAFGLAARADASGGRT